MTEPKFVRLSSALFAFGVFGLIVVLIVMALIAELRTSVGSNNRRVLSLEAWREAIPDGTGKDRWKGKEMRLWAEDLGRENSGLVVPEVEKYRDR